MKKTAYTLIELMISIAILLIVLGTISMVITSHMDVYNAGVKNEETGSKVQTFFSYVIGDLTPEDEEDENNYIEIKKSGNPVNKIEIKRSWHGETDREDVVYTYSNGEIARGEYSKGDDEKTAGSKILSKSKNFDLSGMDLKVRKGSLEKRNKITGNITYEEFTSEELENGVRLALKDGDEKRFNYYIEPVVKVGSGDEEEELSRGYGLRFAPEIEDEDPEEGDGTFSGPLAMQRGTKGDNKINLNNGGHTKYSPDGKLPGVFGDNKEAITCQIIRGDSSDNRMCERTDVLSKIYPARYGDLNSLENLGELKNSKTINEGVYKVSKIDLSGKTITINGNVKLYVTGDVIIKGGKFNYSDSSNSSQLLMVLTGSKEFKLEERAEFKGFVVAYKGYLDKSSKLEGAIIGDESVTVTDKSYIRYTPCDAKIFKKDHIETVDSIWW